MARIKKPLHGGDVHAAARELGCRTADLVDFSASINPLGPSPRVWPAIIGARHLLLHYPDPDCWDLRQALAEEWRCPPEQIVVGNGSTELIYTLPHTLKLKRLLVVQPTFTEYAGAMARAGGEIISIFADRQEQYAFPLDRLCRLLQDRTDDASRIDGVVLCNPNSPTGQVCDAEAVSHLAHKLQRQGIWFIVDETFVDYCPERSLLPLAPSLSRTVVLRSLTKFYGLPGLRVGYAVAAPSVARRLRLQLPPWSVNAIGQVAALAALRDRGHRGKSLRFMQKERARFAAKLATLPGCTVMPAYANYLFLELPSGWHARKMTEALRHEGMLVRDCSMVSGANARSIRVAVRLRRENDRLLQLLARLLSRRSS